MIKTLEMKGRYPSNDLGLGIVQTFGGRVLKDVEGWTDVLNVSNNV